MANRAGKTYIITGGVSGLGLATAQLLYSQGANVSLFDRNDDLANDVIPANFTDASRVLFCKVDITDEGNVKSAVADTVARFGSLHGVVNSAGIGSAMTTVNGKGKTHSSKVFDYVVKINLMGSFYCAAHGAAAMREAGHKDGACERWERKGWDGVGWRGVEASHLHQSMSLSRLCCLCVSVSASASSSNLPHFSSSPAPLLPLSTGVIVNVSSVAGIEGQKGQLAYSASKGAIIGMTLPMARDLSRFGIRVMTIAPGIMETPLMMNTPQKVRDGLMTGVAGPKRFGDSSEFAGLVAHIIDNGYLNGEVIRLDGGIRFPNM